MNSKVTRPLLAALAVLALSACASAPTATPSIATSSSQPVQSSRLGTLIGRAQIGSRVPLPSGNSLRATSARVLHEYPAASGRTCRRIALDNDLETRPRERIVCHRGKGQWTLTRALIPTPDVAKPRPLVTVDPLVSADTAAEDVPVQDLPMPASTRVVQSGNELTEVRLEGDETLWAFARRVTGNALNWQAIADANKIDDATSVSADQRLMVPKALLRLER